MKRPQDTTFNDKSKALQEEYEVFAAIEVEEERADVATPEHILSLKDRLGSELVESRWGAVALYFVLSIFGYAISLSLCAQNTKGLTSFAHHVEHWMHGFGPIVCGLICGFIFSIIPLAVSLLLLGRFRRRHLIARDLWIVQIITVFAALTILIPIDWLSEDASDIALAHQYNIPRVITWSLTAIIVPLALTKAIKAAILIKTRFSINHTRSFS